MPPIAGRVDRVGVRAWLVVTGVLGLGSLAVSLVFSLPAAFDWQPGHGLAEPWRAWTAAFVHWSTGHLLGNLFALSLVAALGRAARVTRADALAWALAWPLTHALFGAVDALAPVRFVAHLPHYGGLSGVLHAGVVIVGLRLVWPMRGERERLVGGALLAGVAAKVLLEAPWDLALRPDSLLGIGVAPIAHATGVIAGLAMGAATRVNVPGLQARHRPS